MTTKPPYWKSFSKTYIDDDNYNLPPSLNQNYEFTHIPIPGYIENSQYPFTYNHSLRYGSNRFSGQDDPDEFKKNLMISPKDWKYRTKQINYIVNSNGYRTKEWKEIDWSESIVLFGCSNTFGVGLAEDETISHHLSQRTGRYVVNLGFPSGSNELIVNNCAAMIKYFGIPYGVVINWSTVDRFRYYTKDNYYELGPWTNENSLNGYHFTEYIDTKKLWELTFADPNNELAKNYYWSTHANAMFQGRTKYCTISYFPITAYYTRAMACFEMDRQARDKVHPGEGNSIEVAEFLTKVFKD